MITRTDDLNTWVHAYQWWKTLPPEKRCYYWKNFPRDSYGRLPVFTSPVHAIFCIYAMVYLVRLGESAARLSELDLEDGGCRFPPSSPEKDNHNAG